MGTTAIIISDRKGFADMCERAFLTKNVHTIYSGFDQAAWKVKLKSSHAQVLLIDSKDAKEISSVLQYILDELTYNRPTPFVCSMERGSVVEGAFLRKGARYVFDPSMSEPLIVDCIMSIYAWHVARNQGELLLPELRRLLRECFISPSHLGYRLICECIQYIVKQDTNAINLTRDVYPAVAQKCDTTAIRVEKNIRDAIRRAWETGGRERIPEILGCGWQKAPPNGDIICSLCEKLFEATPDQNLAGGLIWHGASTSNV